MDPRLRIVSESIENNLKNEAENDPEKTAIVYKLEGCLPSRLPFELPFCKDEDSLGKTVEIHRLFPFTVPSISTSKSASEDTLVFPEIDFARWLRLMSRLRDRRDSSITNDRMNLVEESEEVASNFRHPSFYNDRSSTSTKNYVDGYSFFDLLRYIVSKKELSTQKKKKMPKTDFSLQRTGTEGENEILVEFQLQDEEDLAGTYYDVTENSNSSEGKTKEAEKTNRRNKEFIENVKYPELPRKENQILQEKNVKIETPYFFEDPRKLVKIESDFSHEETIPHDIEKSRNPERRNEFINEKAIPQDARMVKLPRESNEILRSRAIPWNRPSKWRYPLRSFQF